MALIETLVDDFNTSTIDASKWATAVLAGTGTVTSANGSAVFTAANASTLLLGSQSQYTTANSYAYAKLRVPTAVTNDAGGGILQLILSSNAGGGAGAAYLAVSYANGVVQLNFSAAKSSSSATITSINSVTYDPVAMAYVRIRGVATTDQFGAKTTTLYWGYSPNGSSWTEGAGTAVCNWGLSTATDTSISIRHNSNSSAGNQTVYADSVNIVNTAVAYAGTANPTGIGDPETPGTPSAATTITATPTSGADPETTGTPSAATTATTAPTGIGDGEATGAPSAAYANVLLPTGINDVNTVGNPSATSVQSAAPDILNDSDTISGPAVALITAAMPTGINDTETLGIPTLAMVLTTVPYGTGPYGANLYGGNPPAPSSVTPDGINDAETVGTTATDNSQQANAGYGSGVYGMGVYSGGTVAATTIAPTGIGDPETLNGASSDGTATGATNYTYGTGTYGAGNYGGPDTGTTYGGDASTGAATTGYGSGPYGAGIYPGVTVSDTPPTQTSIPLFDNLPAVARTALQLLAIGPWSPTVEFRGAVNYGIGKGRRPARPIMNLPIASSLSVTLRLTGGCEASAAFSFPRGSTIIIEEMHTDLWWRRKDPYSGALDVIGRFNTGTNDISYDGTAVSSSVHFVDYETLIGERLILRYRNTNHDDATHPDAVTSQTSMWNKGDPVASVLRFAIPTNMGIDLSVLDDDTVLGTITAAFSIDPSSSVADVITNVLAISAKPWEWWVEQPADLSKPPTLRVLAGERGTNKGVTLIDLGSGPSPIATWSMQAATTSYANAIYYQAVSGGVVETIPSQITEFGQRDATYSNNTLNLELQPIVNAAQTKLKELADRRPTFSVVLRPGFWRGRTHIDIGDTVRIVFKLGGELLDYRYRVSELQIDIDTVGAETVTLTLGTPLVSADPRSRRSAIFRLLRTLRNYTSPGTSTA